jgi:ribosomal protein S18 acetylase RimI-like enzyme
MIREALPRFLSHASGQDAHNLAREKFMTGPHQETLNLELRPALPSDDALLFKLYASTRLDELSVMPLSKEQLDAFLQMQFNAQRRGHAAQHPTAEQQIILVEGLEVGRILLDRLEKDLHLVDITLLPEFRSRGIGSFILKNLQAEAARDGKSFRLFVYQSNPARRLYERLGFSEIRESGMYVEMLWKVD